MTRPTISAVIPTWGALRFLPACLSALRAQLQPQDEIVLVDNASRDHAGDWARRYAPDVRVISLPANLGFAGGTNAGIRAARGELLLLINDDAMAEPGCVGALWAALRESPRAGAAAGALVFSRRPEVVASAGIIFQGDGVATDLHLGTPVAQMPAEPVEIFGASGGLALLRRAMLDDVGVFAGEFFSYLEDADLAWRARLRGWGAVLAPGARARHVYSATGGQGSPFKQRLLGRNRLRLIVRCLPTPILRGCLPATLRYDLLAAAYGLLRGQPAIVAGRLEAVRELPALLAQRRQIQAARTTPIGELAAWVEPAPAPLAALRTQRRLAALLQAYG
ncbi:glycosyltransferase family 2 protein [Oscillochloris sp. ZM17-4]|uniref:glycosyltransferase family 2 protein n=1 Tax=Oscillochloris sp. ZM17-4 TaxID=2866714 RepID=UPI001C737F08|nr:glycosyltransferase family 2 protein [Oscillochloris sp. ZM17-4]MBX0330301.1 glycosyltransferase family 2 protein [Oscillochloris sp. ZM17-4]